MRNGIEGSGQRVALAITNRAKPGTTGRRARSRQRFARHWPHDSRYVRRSRDAL